MEIRKYRDSDKDDVVALWEEVLRYDSPHNDPSGAIDRKIAVDDLLLVAVDASRVIGTVMGGYDGHRGWIYSLAVAENERHQGVGTALMGKMEQELKALGCLKMNLQVMSSNLGVIEFYEKLGFSVEDRVSMGRRLYNESVR